MNFINLLVSQQDSFRHGLWRQTVFCVKLDNLFNYFEAQFFHLNMGLGGRCAYLIGLMWVIIELMHVKCFHRMALRECAGP